MRLSKAPELIWWEQLVGPSLFLREVADTLLAGRPLCLLLPEAFPWKETFLALLRDLFLEAEQDLMFEELPDAVENPGEFLVSYLGLEAEYRPTKSYGDFLSQKNALSGRFLSVRPKTPQLVQQWLSFAKEYHPSQIDGFLAVETAERPSPNLSRQVTVLAYEEFVSDYDTQIFAGLLISDPRMTTEQKKYLSALAVALKGREAEQVVSFVQDFSFYGDGADIETETVDATRSIWNAQLQILFPLIMKECRDLIETCREAIEDAFYYADSMLPTGLLDSNNERITDPEDIVEIATIHFLMHNKRRDCFGMDTKDYILYIPDETLRARFELLYNMRNRIAHGRLCAFEEVKQLLTFPK